MSDWLKNLLAAYFAIHEEKVRRKLRKKDRKTERKKRKESVANVTGINLEIYREAN